MKNRLYITTLICLLLACMPMYAQQKGKLSPKQEKKAQKEAKIQEKRFASATKQLDKYDYEGAIKTYMSLIDRGNSSPEVLAKLGDAYYFNNQPQMAVKWYSELFKKKKDVDAEYYYRHSQSLKSIGKYEEANVVLKEFTTRTGKDIRAGIYDANKNYLNVIEENSGRYKVKVVDASSKLSDYGPSFYGDSTVVFSSNRDSIALVKNQDVWTKKSFTVFYKAPILEKGNLGKPVRFDSKVQTKFHESTPVFTKDKKTMYFTRNNYNNGKVQKDAKGHVLLKIYKAEATGDGSWKNVTEVSFSSNNYNTAHPALSPDEKTLYFASDMPGSFGGSDIYRVAINDDGTFGTPENLGNQVNTEGRETFPFFTSDKLYFASDGHPGLGGLDVFASKLTNGAFSPAVNLGKPVNGRSDDFGLILNSQTKTGYFSSNRNSGRGSDDIYSVTEIQEPNFMVTSQTIAGIVTDELTASIIEGVKVTLLDKDKKVIGESFTGKEGSYVMQVDNGKAHYVKFEKEGYTNNEISISGNGSATVTVSQKLSRNGVGRIDYKGKEIEIKKGVDLGKIFFDRGESYIRPDAEVEIAEVMSFMNEYPSAKIDVQAHTDCRGTDEYNQQLSERRASSTITYMVSRGVAQNRLTGRGYGETRLINRCDDGVDCSEEEHQQNRRSEFIITGF